MARICELELGHGYVGIQVVSGDYSAQFEEQYEVYVSDLTFARFIPAVGMRFSVGLGGLEVTRALDSFSRWVLIF